MGACVACRPRGSTTSNEAELKKDLLFGYSGKRYWACSGVSGPVSLFWYPDSDYRFSERFLSISN